MPRTEYEYPWVIGAVCPETGHAEGPLSPQLKTKIINTFLERFSQTIPEDDLAVMIWPRNNNRTTTVAGFHTAKSLKVPANITQVRLPPYSPELNPIANQWHDLKSPYWSDRGYDDLEQAAMDAWRRAVLNDALTQTVCATPYLEERYFRLKRV